MPLILVSQHLERHNLKYKNFQLSCVLESLEEAYYKYDVSFYIHRKLGNIIVNSDVTV